MTENGFSPGKFLRDSSGRLRLPIIISLAALCIRLTYFFLVLAYNDQAGLGTMFADTTTYLKAADYLFGRSAEGHYDLYMVGAGYPFFLAVFSSVFGNTFWPVLLFQVILSSASCMMIYKIVELLSFHRSIAFVAGMISAISITSISLASSLLTETLFFFLLVLSIFLYFRGLRSERWIIAIAAGLCGGLMILVRSAAVFIPIIFVIFAFLIPAKETPGNRKRTLIKSGIVALIMISIPLMWVARNKVSHDVFTLSGTGMGAARVYLTAEVLFDVSERPSWEFVDYRDSLFSASRADYETGNFKKVQADAYDLVVSTFKQYPFLYFKMFLSNVWENMTAASSLQNSQLPVLDNRLDYFYPLRWGFQSPVMLLLSLIGLAIIVRRNIKKALILFLILIYFGFLSGITFWQGSRIYYPAQVAQAICAAVTLIFLYDLLTHFIKALPAISRLWNK